ncbi:MAG: Ig-like domain-containing protein [Candidatus Kapabacteria bacterium]|nr:Ig-like domain-containing protein [Candidatus Kapabacteria bacterium]
MKFIRSFVILIIIVFTLNNLSAQTDEDQRRNGDKTSQRAFLQTQKPVPELSANRISWKTTSGGDLDQYIYEYSSRNPITFEIQIPVDVSKLSNVKLTLSVWDVDLTSGEIDVVYLNGHALGQLHGANDSWSINNFNVKSSWLRGGTAASPGINEVKVRLTVKGWAVTVDWGTISADGAGFYISDYKPGANKLTKFKRSEINDLKFKFSDNVDMSTFTDQNIFLRYKKATGDYAIVPVDLSQGTPNSIVALSPKADLLDGVKYWITLRGQGKGLKSINGDTLQKDWYHFPFITSPNIEIDSMFPIQVSRYPVYDRNGAKGSETTKLVPDKKTILRMYYSKWEKKASVADDAQLEEVYVKFRLKESAGGTIVPDKKILVKRYDKIKSDANAKKNGVNTINYTSFWPISLSSGAHSIDAEIEPYDQSSSSPLIFKKTANITVSAFKFNRFYINYAFTRTDSWKNSVPEADRTFMTNLLSTCKAFLKGNFPIYDVTFTKQSDLVFPDLGSFTFTQPKPAPPTNVSDTPFDDFINDRVISHPHYSAKANHEYFIYLVPNDFGSQPAAQGYSDELNWTGTNYGVPGKNPSRLISLRRNIPDANGNSTGANPSTVVHEFGHDHGLAIEFPNETEGTVNGRPDKLKQHTTRAVASTEGFFVEKNKNKSFSEGNSESDNLYSLMSKYIQAVPDRWIWNCNYDKLYDLIATVQQPSSVVFQENNKDEIALMDYREQQVIQAGTTHLAIYGTFPDRIGNICDIRPVWEYNLSPQQYSGSGIYTAELVNKSGTVAASYKFQGFSVTSHDASDDTSWNFYLSLPKPSDFCKLRILKNTTVIKEIICNQNAPVVNIKSPASAANLNGTQTVSWDCTDADGDVCIYQLLISTNNGISWETIVNNYNKTSIDIDFSEYASSKNCILRVSANDGHFNITNKDLTCSNSSYIQLLLTNPLSEEKEVGVNVSIEISFNTEINDSTLSSECFKVFNANTNQPVSGKIENIKGSKSIKFTPDKDLDYSAKYSVSISTSLKDVNGSILQNPFTFYFYTVKSPYPFEIRSTVPDGGALGVPVNSNITLMFDRDVNPSTIISSNFAVINQQTKAPLTFSVTYNPANFSAVLTAANKFDYDTPFQITAIKNIQSKAGDTLKNDYIFSFVTSKDSIAGVRITDKYSDYGIDDNSNGLYNFLAIDVEIEITSDGEYLINGQLVDSSNKEIGWASFTKSFTRGVYNATLKFPGENINAYKVNGPYFLKNLQVYNTKNTDQSDYRDSAFTTSIYKFTQFENSNIPVVLKYNPEDLSLNVPITTNISAVFSAPMNSSNLNETNFYVRDKNGNNIASTINYDKNTLTATLTPKTALLLNSLYNVSVLQACTDTSGNKLLQQYNWSFTTGSNSSSEMISDVISYPNPFPHSSVPSGDMFFTYNLKSGSGKVEIYIYNLSGDLVKAIEKSVPADQGLNEYQWNGRAENDKLIASGTYTYLIKFTDSDNKEYYAKASFTVIR